MRSDPRCACGDFWAEHDIYGCQKFGCACLMIDRATRFDKATRSAVPA